MKMLTKEQILSAKDLKSESLDVPEWGGAVLVSEMTAFDRMEWELEVFDDDGKPMLPNWKAKLVVRCVVDDDGNCLFSPEEAADIGGKSPGAVDRVYRKARDINGFGAKASEDAEKN